MKILKSEAYIRRSGELTLKKSIYIEGLNSADVVFVSLTENSIKISLTYFEGAVTKNVAHTKTRKNNGEVLPFFRIKLSYSLGKEYKGNYSVEQHGTFFILHKLEKVEKAQIKAAVHANGQLVFSDKEMLNFLEPCKHVWVSTDYDTITVALEKPEDPKFRLKEVQKRTLIGVNKVYPQIYLMIGCGVLEGRYLMEEHTAKNLKIKKYYEKKIT